MKPTFRKNPSIFKKKYCPNQPSSRGCQNTNINSNRTVYVNARSGTSQGRLGNPSCPFRTITQAIDAIKNISRTVESQWLVIIGPGVFDENVQVPYFINLEGAGKDLTLIKGLSVEGSSTITKLGIVNNTLPLLRTELNSEEPDKNKVSLTDIKILADNISNTQNGVVISTNGDGLNNIVEISNSTISAIVNRSNPALSNQVLFDINAPIILTNVIESFVVDYKAPASQFNLKNSLTINGGQIEFVVTEGPAAEMNMFNLDSGNANLSLCNNLSRINVLVLREAYKADVSFIKANSGVSAIVSNSTAELDGVSRDFFNLVNNQSNETDIEIISLSTPRVSFPRIKGNKQNIKYVGLSGNGDIVASGGLYSNIIQVDSETYPDFYPIQENDQTILSNGATVGLFDPSLADDAVTDKGKFVIIKNIGTTAINIVSDNNTIYDGDQILQPGQSITFQNDAVKWYRVGN